MRAVSGDLFHIVAEFQPGKASAFGFDNRGIGVLAEDGEARIVALNGYELRSVRTQ